MNRLIDDPSRTALLIMDYQTGIVDMLVKDSSALLQKVADLAGLARSRRMPIIFVTVGFRPGYPEVSPFNQSFSLIKQSQRFAPSSPGSELHPRIIVDSVSDVMIVKHRVGAFCGTDLDMILRSQAVHTILLCGLATSGVVLSTLRHAADHDYRCIVLKDLCADQDEEVHRVLMDKVFPRQAKIVDSSEVSAELATGV